jgi:uroporphyrinogen decarboxylase
MSIAYDIQESRQMKPRERVLKAIAHQNTDRIPRDLGSTSTSGIHKIAYRNLLEYLGHDSSEIEDIETHQQLAKVDEAILEKFKIDVRGVWERGMLALRPPECSGSKAGDLFKDTWGCVWRLPPGGLYYDVVESPLADAPADLKVLDDYPWPDPHDQTMNLDAIEEARRLHEGTDYAVFGQCFLSFFGLACFLRGFSQFLMDLVLNRNFAEALMDRILDNHEARNHHFLNAVGDHVDIVGYLGDDYATQQSTLISPALYREVMVPRQRRIIDFVRRYTDAPFFMHQDGAIFALMEDIIDVGADILNPVQYSADGMGDTRKLKEQFGDRLTFWGGGVDAQDILPHGSPDDVREEVKRRVGDLSPGGGYIFATVHNIQPDVPPENILAIYEALDEFENQ